MKITREELNNLKEKIKKEGDYKVGVYRGFKYKILRHSKLGQLNWYVLLPEGYKYYWKDYEDIDVKVHWWLTYSWWEGKYWKIGFDCAHCDDLCPYTIEYLMEDKDYIEYFDWTYKDMKFVEEEIKRLIGQLHLFTKILKW